MLKQKLFIAKEDINLGEYIAFVENEKEIKIIKPPKGIMVDGIMLESYKKNQLVNREDIKMFGYMYF